MTLIKDLIEIPERVQKGDYVLRLAEDVGRPEVVLGNYVVTPELRDCFDNALTFIQSSLQSNTSKGSYLHGSFGSGKSHFMAVLHLILQGNTAARAIPELAPVIAKHNHWIGGKKFLLVPYHMIGAHDMESGILGGYVEFIRRTQPQAPIPGVYLAEGLFRDAQALCETLGDEKFFAKLNEGADSDGGWGDLNSSWDASRFETAIIAPPGSEDRSQLISSLIRQFFGSYDTQAGGRGEAFVSLDKGLSVISRHTAQLGYDGLILFLDELILWLASHAADMKFLHQEGQKLAKLVEAQTPDRPVPVVSFIARQRDLRELIGDAVPGASLLNFGDALRHWEDRFHKITLEDRNLPAIAEKRVLKCKTESARKELDAAFDQTAKMRESVMNILLTTSGDRQMFRRVYPFSPALVQTLIAVSSVLQRERTALKVMVQLLVEQRETLKVGDVVPVGDLFDVIAHGEDAFSPEMAIHFNNAKRLYHHKLLPALERATGGPGLRREEIEQLPFDDPRRIAFRNDDRLVKTLLLSALLPDVESLRGLNAERLAALNHGTIKTPIPGREAQLVLSKCRTWAASVGEMRLGQEANPTISIQLSGVDTASILAQAQGEDSQGNRSRLVRQILFTQLDIAVEGDGEQFHEFWWRNTKRDCKVLFRNIRELPESSFENNDESWRLVIDFPFDEPGYGPRDDLSKLQSFRQSHAGGAQTMCWIPAFFSEDAQRDLGTLVVLEHILAGERFGQYSNHMSPQDRQSAKSLLENQRSVLRQRVQNHLEAAYGLDALLPGSLDTVHDLELSERFVALRDGFVPRPPVAANLGQAMTCLLSQALEHEFPAAPDFGAEIKATPLKKVFEQIMPATQSADGRVAVDRTLRPLIRQIANPLLLGEMGLDATHFVLGQHWRQHFARKAAETGSAMSVSQLRKWFDDPKPMGLPKEAQNLVLLIFAAQTNRTFFLHNGPCEVTLSNVPDQCELHEQRLPDESQWAVAVQRASSIFGATISRLLNASNVSTLASEVKRHAAQARQACKNYCQQIRDRMTQLSVAADSSDRLRTGLATWTLMESLQNANGEDVVRLLAAAEIATSETAMGECAAKAAELEGNLETAGWEIFDAIRDLTDDRSAAATAILTDVANALSSDEHVVALAPALKSANAKAVRLLTKKPTTFEPPIIERGRLDANNKQTLTDRDNSKKEQVLKGVIPDGSRQDLNLAEAQAVLDQLGKETKPSQSVRINVSWVIEEGPAK
ncbi:MAG: phage resistance protein [Planctomycetaceae bacterium]